MFRGRSRGSFAFFSAQRMAPATALPDEPPHKRPSSRMSRRAMVKLSRSVTWTMSSMDLRSMVEGMKSSPMPST